jgi:hypothetical protein
MLRAFLFMLLLLPVFLLLGQEITTLNPSFEGIPQHSQVPRYWTNCGPPDESPPDTQPEKTFDVSLPAYHGNTYLGLVTRDNDTWEAVTAYLTAPLEVDACYGFSIAIACSPSYFSVSRATGQFVNYTAPTRLRIWGSNGNCQQEELLGESTVVMHKDWETQTFVIKPLNNSYTSIILEAYYIGKVRKPTNGHLLLDAASAFYHLPNCDLKGFTMPELSAASEVVTINGDNRRSTGATPEVVSLKLPDASFFNNEEALRSFVANALEELAFDGHNQLAMTQFQLADEQQVRNGHPAWYALQYALQFYPDQKWELIIYTDDKLEKDLRVLELGQQPTVIGDINLTVVGYDARKHYGYSWFCMSVSNGLYLRML